jgi:thioesterase domain-containing protein
VATAPPNAGESVALLIILDGYPSTAGAPKEALDAAAARTLLVAEALGEHAKDDVNSLSFPRLQALLERAASPLASLTEEQFEALFEEMARNSILAEQFVPNEFDGDVLVITSSTADADPHDLPARWTPHITGTVETHSVRAPHHLMMAAGTLADIGPLLAARLGALDPVGGPT